MQSNKPNIIIIQDVKDIAHMKRICDKLYLGPAHGISIVSLECTEEFFKKIANAYCRVAGIANDGLDYKIVLKQIKKAFSHPVLINYNPDLQLYAIHPCTHSDMAPDLYGELRKTIMLGGVDFKNVALTQYICDTGYYLTKELGQDLIRLEHLKFNAIASEEVLYKYLTDTVRTERLEQLTQLMHLRAKELGTADFLETTKMQQFTFKTASYDYMRLNKMACYIKKLT